MIAIETIVTVLRVSWKTQTCSVPEVLRKGVPDTDSGYYEEVEKREVSEWGIVNRLSFHDLVPKLWWEDKCLNLEAFTGEGRNFFKHLKECKTKKVFFFIDVCYLCMPVQDGVK